MSRKNISDFTGHKDRQTVRELRSAGSSYASSWDDWEQGKLHRSYTTVSGANSKTPFVRCYPSHKPMPLPGTELVIYGGSCGSPIVKGADVYIGFDRSMELTKRQYPWNKGSEIYFRVPDMGIPDDAAEYKKLVAWTKKKLDEGLKVHVGCIGGHGRTGMFFAALVSRYGTKDAIAYVRENYCAKAVESKSQVAFLNSVFGVTPAAPTKDYSSKSSVSSYGNHYDDYGSEYGEKTRAFPPLTGERGIWG